MHFLQILSILIAGLFFLCYSYQFLYIPVAFRRRKTKAAAPRLHKFAVLICA